MPTTQEETNVTIYEVPKTTIGGPEKLDAAAHSHADLVRNILRHNFHASIKEVNEFYGLKDVIKSNTISGIRAQLRNLTINVQAGSKPNGKAKMVKMSKAKAAKAAKAMTPVEPTADKAINVATVRALQDQVAYLEWQVTGERKQYFDRWLNERDA